MLTRQALRYLLAGGVNTAFSYAVYLALLTVMAYQLAYLLAFLSGIAVSYLLMRYTVFRQAGRRFSMGWVALSHLGQLGLGLLLVEAWVRGVGGPAAWAPLFAVAVCVPLMFLVQRWIFARGMA